ncbi:MAG: polysaccharide pyruvyl transferase family protein [Mogibacterium sp.]|nr:polysaccharide pyruvyl transferase family protein [Mogibacterium sp.]
MKQIPKTIHYCWIGDKPKPESVLRCIDSWRRFCPDYEIIEWNESNYDFTKNEFMRQAYDAGKWGFVPDYARLDIIFEHGGIYFDTDVELIRNTDHLLGNEAFAGFENTGDGESFAALGLGFGASANNPLIKKLRDAYENISFINDDGTYNLKPSPYYTTRLLQLHGLRQKDMDQKLDGISIFASDVFCPKNYRTGRIEIKERTVSIHHFDASWADGELKDEEEYQRRIYGAFGKSIGRKLLYVESVLEKYSMSEIVRRLPSKLAQNTKKNVIAIKDAVPWYYRLIRGRIARTQEGQPMLILDTYMGSDNEGDAIIMESCMNQLAENMDIGSLEHISTHIQPSSKDIRKLKEAGEKILCGTNLLSGYMRSYGLWKTGKDVSLYRNTRLMGVGFDSMDESFDKYSAVLFQTILSRDGYHSVRDSFSERKLRAMGIKNVINTGCPSMWKLTPSHCESIPTKKAGRVICTMTDYRQNEKEDREMLKILFELYEEVYFWQQGRGDLEYLRKLGFLDRMIILGKSLSDYDDFLQEKDIDYVGTRLHAGIRALTAGHRALIVAVDNRADCIANDTGLPVIRREDIGFLLRDYLMGETVVEIHLRNKNIKLFLNQFNQISTESIGEKQNAD